MTLKTMGSSALVATAVLAGTASPALSAEPSPSATQWQHYDVPVQGRAANLTSLAVPGRNDAWAAGFMTNFSTPASKSPDAARAKPESDSGVCDSSSDAFTSLMLHWDGHAWSQTSVPAAGSINRLSSTSADDIWAATDCGLLRFDGTAWQHAGYADVPAEQVSINDVSADGPHDAWLAGSTYDSGTEVAQGFVQRWDGREWRPVPLPDFGNSYEFDSIAAHGPNDVWAAGTIYADEDHPDELLLMHWDGHSWKRLPEPATDAWTKLVSKVRITGDDDAWVVGFSKAAPDHDQTRHPMILHWDGHHWTTSPAPDGPGELYDVARSGGRLWAVGDTFSSDQPSYTMYVLRWAGDRWMTDAVPDTGDGMINAVAAVPGGGTWAVGATGNGSPHPVIARQG